MVYGQWGYGKNHESGMRKTDVWETQLQEYTGRSAVVILMTAVFIQQLLCSMHISGPSYAQGKFYGKGKR